MRGVRRPRWVLAIGGLVVALVAAVVWFGLTAWQVVSQLSAARNDLISAQTSVADRDVEAASTAITSAAGHAAAARSHASSPIWGLAASVPIVGATPDTVRAIATALDQAVGAMAPAVQVMVTLSPAAFVGPDGRVDGAAIASPCPPCVPLGPASRLVSPRSPPRRPTQRGSPFWARWSRLVRSWPTSCRRWTEPSTQSSALPRSPRRFSAWTGPSATSWPSSTPTSPEASVDSSAPGRS